MRGNIILYGCGGAGTNIVADIKDDLIALGEGFSTFETRIIDTTNKTVQKYEDLQNNFYKIESDKITNSGIDGAAGERKNLDLVKDIQSSLMKYMDNVVKSNNKNDYHIVIFSASGGSGSVIGSVLTSLMLKQDYNVIPIVVGDESSLLNIKNTLNTIVGLNKIAKQNKAALGLVLFNNSIDGITTTKYEKEVNHSIKAWLTVLSMFVSGDMRDIDQQDMNNFIIPTRYKSFEVSPGIYKLGSTVGRVDDPNTILVRTAITENNKIYVIDVPLLHNKVGTASNNHIEVFSDNSFPLYLTFKKNEIGKDVEKLQKRHDELEKLKHVESNTLDALEDSLEDDSGLVL